MEEARELANLIQERYKLVLQRVYEVASEPFGHPEAEAYFHVEGRKLLLAARSLEESRKDVPEGQALLEEKDAWEDYEGSYADPAFAVARFGTDLGQVLSFLSYEMGSLRGYASAGRQEEMLVRMELFSQVHALFSYEWEENKGLPEAKELRECVYWFAWDYACLPGLGSGRSILERDWLWPEHMEEEARGLGRPAYDHWQDFALFWDRGFAGHQLEVLRSALEQEAAGRRAVHPSGEAASAGASSCPGLANKPQSLRLTHGQRQLWEKYCRKARALREEYGLEEKDGTIS